MRLRVCRRYFSHCRPRKTAVWSGGVSAGIGREWDCFTDMLFAMRSSGVMVPPWPEPMPAGSL